MTTEPDQICSPGRCGIATGCSVQCRKSGLDAWPQLMCPQSDPCGLCWKKTCQMPLTKTSPLGSFIQLRAGVKWNAGPGDQAAHDVTSDGGTEDRRARDQVRRAGAGRCRCPAAVAPRPRPGRSAGERPSSAAAGGGR